MISCDDIGDNLGEPHKGVDGCNRGDAMSMMSWNIIDVSK